MYHPVSMLALAQQDLKDKTDAAKRASDNYTASVDHLGQLQQASIAIHNNVASATKDVDNAQHKVNDTLAKFGQDSPQYHAAVQTLADKEAALNQQLANEATNNLAVSATSLDVTSKLQIQGQAVDAVRQANDSLNMSLHGTVDVIGHFGPAAAAQVQSIAVLQNAVSGVISSWGGFVGGLQAQNAKVNDILFGTSSTIDRLQTQGGNLVTTLQKASTLQVGAGGGLQGSSGGGLQHNALGTNYAPGGLSIVGENGPEIVNLPQGSQVHNAQDSRGMSLGQQVTNVLSGTFNFQNAEASNAFWDRLDKTQRLARMGMA